MIYWVVIMYMFQFADKKIVCVSDSLMNIFSACNLGLKIMKFLLFIL